MKIEYDWPIVASLDVAKKKKIVRCHPSKYWPSHALLNLGHCAVILSMEYRQLFTSISMAMCLQLETSVGLVYFITSVNDQSVSQKCLPTPATIW